MSFVNGVYTNPGWANENSPPINATNLNDISDCLELVQTDISSLESNFNLNTENIPGTVQTIAFDSSGNVQSITHSSSGSAVRTDVFTFTDSTITEVRTLADTGETLTITTNLTTLETTVVYAA